MGAEGQLSLTEREFLSRTEAGQVLGFSARTVDRLTADARAGLGDFPLPVRIRRKLIRYRRRDLVEWADRLHQN